MKASSPVPKPTQFFSPYSLFLACNFRLLLFMPHTPPFHLLNQYIGIPTRWRQTVISEWGDGFISVLTVRPDSVSHWGNDVRLQRKAPKSYTLLRRTRCGCNMGRAEQYRRECGVNSIHSNGPIFHGNFRIVERLFSSRKLASTPQSVKELQHSRPIVMHFQKERCLKNQSLCYQLIRVKSTCALKHVSGWSPTEFVDLGNVNR